MSITMLQRGVALVAALESMSPELLAYKGLAESKAAIVAWLAAGRAE